MKIKWMRFKWKENTTMNDIQEWYQKNMYEIWKMRHKGIISYETFWDEKRKLMNSTSRKYKKIGKYF